MSKYLKQDSEKGYVEDYVEIRSLIFDNVRHAALGNMMGDYDDNGFYRVNPEIVKELIEMPKYVVEVMDNLEICLSTIKLDKQISFLVAFEGEKATLSLIEKINFEANSKSNCGTWSNVNEYVLDVVDTFGEIDRQSLYLRWNILTFPGEVIDIFNCEDSVLAKYFNIVARFKYNLEAKTVLLEKEENLEEVDAEYIMDLFQILQGYPELKKAVEKQIKASLAEKQDFVKLDKPNFANTMKEIVEKAIQDNVDVLKESDKQSFNIEKRNITIKSNIKKYEVLNIETVDCETVNQKEKQDELLDIEQTAKNKINLIGVENVNLKSIDVISKEYVSAELGAFAKAEKKARKILGEESAKTNLAKLVQQLVKSGVAIETLLSIPAIISLVNKKASEKEIVQVVKEEKNKSANVVPAAEEKNENKKTQKKETKKKKVEKKTEKDATNKTKAQKGGNNNGVYISSFSYNNNEIDTEAKAERVNSSGRKLKAEERLQQKAQKGNEGRNSEDGLIKRYLQEESLSVGSSILEFEKNNEVTKEDKVTNTTETVLTGQQITKIRKEDNNTLRVQQTVVVEEIISTR